MQERARDREAVIARHVPVGAGSVRGVRPAVRRCGAQAQHLVIEWGNMAGPHVFCAVLAWSRFRFVRFAADERAETTPRTLVECFEVLEDRMGCFKGGVGASVVVSTAEYVRFACITRPVFREAADPESKGIVTNLVGYAKADLMVPDPVAEPGLRERGREGWCAEVNSAVHNEICAVPADRLVIEPELMFELPSWRPSTGKMISRRVAWLS